MKRKTLSLIAALGLILALCAGCSKQNTTVFSWNYLGRHYVADSSFASAGTDTRIAAYYSVTGLGIGGGGSQLAVGSYPLHGNNTNGQAFLFYVVGGYTYSQSGTLTVTKYGSGRMSGYFSATLTDGTAMSGSFTNIPLR